MVGNKKKPGGKVGLALSGGGFSGAGAATGFACAIDLLMKNRSINQLAYYSGISAGALVSSFLAAGISPLDMVHGTFGAELPGYRPFRKHDLYRPNWGELGMSLRRLSKKTWARTSDFFRRGKRDEPQTGVDVLPSGILSNEPLKSIVQRNLESQGKLSFADLSCHLRVVFYDLLAAERIVAGNGPGEISSIPIAEAVVASAAIPGVFTPRRIQWEDRTLLGVDGSAGGASIDIRDDENLNVLFVYNHMGFTTRKNVGHIGALGILDLSRQLLSNQSNVQEIATYIDSHPARHVWYYESPSTKLAGMLSYAALLSQARETFDLTKSWLSRHIDYFGLVLEDNGISINPLFSETTFDDIIEKGHVLKGN